MSKLELTPWFPADVKPPMVGWWHTDCEETDKTESLFNWWWDGDLWLSGPNGWVSKFQTRSWRGLAHQPKE